MVGLATVAPPYPNESAHEHNEVSLLAGSRQAAMR